MAVQVWIGEKPEHPNERRAIVALANGLDRLDGLYLILANFSVGGRNIDLVLIKQDAIFIVELKQCDGKIFGDVNGPWFVESANGERKRLNPGRKNPYNQVISYYYSLINFLNEHRTQFLSPQKATSVDFRTCKRLVVIAPTIQEGSQVETDWKVELKGLDELPAYLVTERSSEIDLSEEEMLAIPELLHCTRWNEVNSLLAGVLPRWDAIDSPFAEQAAAPAAAAPPEPAVAASPAPPTLWSRGRRALHTWTGRAAVLMSALALVLAAALIALATRRAPVLADQTASGIVSTSQAAGGLGFGGVVSQESCVWNEFQSVGRRRGGQPGSWENVGVGGNAPSLQPEVVVTLEEVNFCQEAIKLTWSVRNNLDDESVALPLTVENIAVSDSLLNDYQIADDKSQPPQISVAPRSKARGTAVVARPANLNAKVLRVKLKQLPFGEATWIVPISSAAK
ncbi:nuclease-related domain-containing protein [Kouleothrix sp.]|uniref:nuclease-related domain-containing protein n=1 Tax=Kouleothrix sp. TaxID=2779161 RepID=UPI003919CBB0